jgi:hypothetical protein
MIEGYVRQVVMLSLLQALRRHGSWCGETHVQKSTFFLEEGLAVPLGLDFYMYKYGPFSSDLQQILGEMRANYLIDVEPKAPYGPSLVVSESGRDLVDRFPRTKDRYAATLDFVAARFGARPVADLERLSTALFVRKERSGLTEAEQARRVMELKPHLAAQQAEEAVTAIGALLAEATAARLVDAEAARS